MLFSQIQTNTVNKQKAHHNCQSLSGWLDGCFQQILCVCDDTPTSVEQGARCHNSSTMQLLLCAVLASDTSVPVVTLKAPIVTLPSISFFFFFKKKRSLSILTPVTFTAVYVGSGDATSAAGLTLTMSTLPPFSPEIWFGLTLGTWNVSESGNCIQDFFENGWNVTLPLVSVLLPMNEHIYWSVWIV